MGQYIVPPGLPHCLRSAHLGDLLTVPLVRLQDLQELLVHTLVPAVSLLDSVNKGNGVIELDSALLGLWSTGGVSTIRQDVDG